MSPINKFEAVGIFASVAVMAVALGLLRFMASPGGDIVAVAPASQQASVVSVQNSLDNVELSDALKNSISVTNELVKLIVDDVRIGTGPSVKDGDTLTVDYIGTTQDGVRFDDSYKRGTPFTFTIGSKMVIEGWEKGLIGMKVGGQRILVIPADMAYGNRQVGPIAPNSPLVFTVELLKID